MSDRKEEEVKKILRFALLILATIAASNQANSTDYQKLYGNPNAQRKFMEAKIHEHFPGSLGYTMVAIANCESRDLIHWLPDGRLRPNSSGKSSAAGTFQILLKLHHRDIRRLRLDMRDVDDYLRFVKYLYKQQGFHPWDASRSCWQRRIAKM